MTKGGLAKPTIPFPLACATDVTKRYPEPETIPKLRQVEDKVPSKPPADIAGHVRVYLFAEYYGINQLKKLALYQLHSVFTSPKKYPSLCHNWTLGVQECYEHTCNEDDEMRKLLFSYFISHKTHFWKMDNFRELVFDCRAFGQNFITGVIDKA